MTDPWRYRCPHGDSGWLRRTQDDQHGDPAASKYYCHTCQKYGRDPHFDRLHDAKDGVPL